MRAAGEDRQVGRAAGRDPVPGRATVTAAHSFLSRPNSRSTALQAGEPWALRREDVDALGGVVHVRQTVKRDVAGRETVDMYDARSARRRTARPGRSACRAGCATCWLRSRHSPLPAQARSTRVFHTASGMSVYHTVFMRRAFGPAEAALPS
jgi:hypothetical protein